MIMNKKKVDQKSKIISENISSDIATGTVAYKDYNLALKGKAGYKIFERMLKSDSRVRSLYNSIVTPIMQNNYYVDAEDENQAEFIKNIWFEKLNFRIILRDLLSAVCYSHSFLEYAIKINNKNNLYEIDKIAGIDIHTLDSFVFDKTGEYIGLNLTGFKGGDFVQSQFIPKEKLISYFFNKDSQNKFGESAFRSIYMNWDMKSNLLKSDVVNADRYGVGVPIVSYSNTRGSKARANQIGRAIRSHENSFISVPFNKEKNDIYEAEILQSAGSQLDIIKSVEFHNKEMTASILAFLMNLAQTSGSSGSYSLGVVFEGLFSGYLNGITTEILGEINKVNKKLIILNFGEQEHYPKVLSKDFKAIDQSAFSEMVMKFFQTGVFNSNDINRIRNILGFDDIKSGDTPAKEPIGKENTNDEKQEELGKKADEEATQSLRQNDHSKEIKLEEKELDQGMQIIDDIFTRLKTESQEILKEVKDKAIFSITDMIKNKKEFGKKPFFILKSVLAKKLKDIYIYAEKQGSETVSNNLAVELSEKELIERIKKYSENVSLSYFSRLEAVARDIITSTDNIESMSDEELHNLIIDRVNREVSKNYIQKISAKSYVWFHEGRQAEALREKLKFAEYTAILDVKTCSVCNEFDGLRLEYSPNKKKLVATKENNKKKYYKLIDEYGNGKELIVSFPNLFCKGHELCRCVAVYKKERK